MSSATEECIRRCLRSDILQARSYNTSNTDSDNSIRVRLDAAESPYNPVSRELLHQSMADVEINRYPPGDAATMIAAIRRYFDIPDEYGVIAGNGSDELIQIIATSMATRGACALATDPTFVMYRQISTIAQLQYISVPLQQQSLQIDMPAMRAAIKKYQPGIIWLANPNNPTGLDCDTAIMREIVELAPGVVVVDEAYQPYAGSAGILRQQLPANVLLLRTLSKIGFAGLRIGVLIAQPQWIQQLDKVRLPYNISITSQQIAISALHNSACINDKIKMICTSREQLRQQLQQTGYHVWPSAANFLLVRVDDADRSYSDLASHGIAVKNMHNSNPLLRNCLRITVGNAQQNEQLLDILRR